MTDQVETVTEQVTEAAPAAFKTKAVPSDTPTPEPAKPAEKPVAEVEEVEESPEETDTEDSAASDGADPPAHPKNKGVGKRINELTREKHDALREAQYWKEQALKAEAPKPVQEAPAQAASQEGEPKPEDFDFDPIAFNRAHYKWLREEERRQEQAQQRQRTFTEKESAFRAENPDYDEVAHAPHVPITQDMAVAILETENPPAIAYYLGKNPDEAAAIAAMTPIAAARAIGRIEAKLEAPPAPVTPREPPKKTTNAPPPPKTVSGAGKPEVSVDNPDISPAQRIALWKAQRKT